jgi:hypothetical protein
MRAVHITLTKRKSCLHDHERKEHVYDYNKSHFLQRYNVSSEVSDRNMTLMTTLMYKGRLDMTFPVFNPTFYGRNKVSAIRRP